MIVSEAVTNQSGMRWDGALVEQRSIEPEIGTELMA